MNKPLNRFLCLALTLCLLLTLLPAATVRAAETEEPTEAAVTEDPTASEETSAPTEPTETQEESTPEETVATEPDTSWDTSGTCGGNLTWEVDDSGTLTISGTGDMVDYKFVRDPFCNYTNAPWFSRLEFGGNIKKVLIREGVTSIGAYAFYTCYNLESVEIPEGITKIGEHAFYGCKLTNVTLPESVTSIGAGAFAGCDFTSITIPENVASIGADAFSWDESTGIRVDERNTHYSSDDKGVLFNKDKTVLVAAPKGIQGDYSIPDSVTTLEYHAFCSCDDLTSITIPEGVTRIGEDAFEYCSGLTSVYFRGDAPVFDPCKTHVRFYKWGDYYVVEDIFYKVTAEVYYPAGNSTWTEDVRKDYGGKITWIPYTPGQPISSTVPMYRLYNPFTQEHLLSGDEKERDALVGVGWKLDGVAWQAPTEGEPVYRLYNPFDDWHTYSRSQEEIANLTALGWTVDGAVTFSAPKEDGIVIFRLFNPYVQKNYHLLTASTEEWSMLLNAGWKMDGGAWYAAKP